MEVVDRPTAFTQGNTGSDTGLDVAIRFVDSFRHAHTKREVARDSSCWMSILQNLEIPTEDLTR